VLFRSHMIIIKNERDLENLMQRKNIDASVIQYIVQYFNFFVGEVGIMSPDGLSIEKSGVIVLVEQTDHDLAGLGYIPNLLNAIPEGVQQNMITGNDGKKRVLLHSLFLTNNEFGVDVIGLQEELSGEIKQKLESELENNK
jgi:hypothetical protein